MDISKAIKWKWTMHSEPMTTICSLKTVLLNPTAKILQIQESKGRGEKCFSQYYF